MLTTKAYNKIYIWIDCLTLPLRTLLIPFKFYLQGVRSAERETFELIPDDERQCEVCKTTCFLSAVSCSCTDLDETVEEEDGTERSGYKKICCLRHFKDLCSECPPSKHVLKYRYTLDELPLMLVKLKSKAGNFKRLLKRVKEMFDYKEMNRRSSCDSLLDVSEKKLRTNNSAEEQQVRA